MTMAQPKFNTEEAKKDFSNPEIVKRYVQYRPTPPTSIVSTVLDFLRQEKQECDAKHQPTSVSQVIKDGGMSLCVDVGCGSGQSTEIYADHFERVIGLDVSQEQLDAARVRNSRPNLSYWEGQGEDLPLEDESVDLITCSSSFHWLNVHAFFAEVQRVLRPGGVLACYWYRLPECHYGSHSLSDIFEEVWESWKEYWPACHHFVMNDYVELPNLYPDQVTVRLSEKKFLVEHEGSLDDFLGFIRSTAVFQRLKLDQGAQQAELSVASLRDRLVSKMGSGNEGDTVTLRYYYALRMWRKPSP